jgi:integrase
MSKPIRVRDAPGLIWRKRASGWEARWQCRTDIVEAGYPVKSVKLGTFAGDPTKEEWDFIADTCVSLQQEMLVFSRGGLPVSAEFDGTLSSLMRHYRTDPDSPFRKIRYHSKCYYETLMGLIERDHGTEPLAELKGRMFRRWHEAWSEGGKIAVAHGKVGMLRTIFGFGASILEDPECIRLKNILRELRFEMPKPRKESLTAEQATAIRAMAHEKGRPSIALAQAFQFECMLRQKDVIGEWVPMSEPGMSEVFHGNFKWLRGIRWEEIDQNMVLTHITSKRQKEIKINLINAPMVIEEIAKLKEKISHSFQGPIIVSEMDGLPWEAVQFRRWWRICAEACGIDKNVRNMDSRAGAITEADDAGADLDDIREHATHANVGMTRRYSRHAERKIATVQKIRNDSRNKTETK